MTRAEIAACRDAYSLRELYRKHNPQGSVAKMEYFINKVMRAREKKQCTNYKTN